MSDSRKQLGKSGGKANSNSSNNNNSSKARSTSGPSIRDEDVPEVSRYARGDIAAMSAKRGAGGRGVQQHKHLRKTMAELKDKIVTSAAHTAATEILNPDADGGGFIATSEGEATHERTFKLRQGELRQHVDLNTEKNILNLQLTRFGPYRVNYSRNGRFMLFAGQKGHVGVLDCMKMTVGTELHLQETVHDAAYLHNESLFATAQRNYAFVYDNRGVEIHCLKHVERPYRLTYLPYHHLLASVGHSGWLKWQDISTGTPTAGHATGHGPCWVLKQNPHNAVSHVGHSNGVVGLWSPASGKALASMFCHKAAVTDIAIDRSGTYMATAGHDSLMKIWDLRKFTCLHAYKTDHPVQALDFSDKGLLAMAVGRTVQILKDPHLQPHLKGSGGGGSDSGGSRKGGGGEVASTYMRYEVQPPRDNAFNGGSSSNSNSKSMLASSIAVRSVKFRPLEDVLALGSSHGIDTIVVPGAGESNYDANEANPFMNSKQRREAEVQGLLHKLSYDTIGLDPSFLGKVDSDQAALRREHSEVLEEANRKKAEAQAAKAAGKKRARGRNKISAKLRRKQKNVVDAQSVKLRTLHETQKAARQKEHDIRRGVISADGGDGDGFDPLARFAKKR